MSFSKQLLSGAIYTAIAKYSSLAISLLITAVLARILSPEDFGIVAIATIIIQFFSTVTTVGISPAIVQHKDLSKEELDNIYSFTILLAVIFTCVFCIISPIISYTYKKEELKIICCLLSLNIFFSFVNIVPNALLLKEKLFRFIAIRTLLVQVIIGILAIISALKGAGIYSLLMNPIVGSILIYIITIQSKYIKLKLHFHIQWSAVRKIARYSIYQALFNMSYLLYRNIDKLIIGHINGMQILGYYEKSYRLMMLPLENVSNVIGPVLHPLLSDIQNKPEEIINKYLKIQRLLSYVGFPLTVFCFFSAEDLIIILFGTQWEPSVSIFKILSLSVGIQVVQSSIGPIYQSLNETKRLFVASFISLVIVIAAIMTGFYFGGIKYVAMAIVFAFYAIYLIYHILLCYAKKYVYLRNFISVLIPAILLSLGLAVIISVSRHYIAFENHFLSLIYNIVLIALFLIVAFTKILKHK